MTRPHRREFGAAYKIRSSIYILAQILGKCKPNFSYAVEIMLFFLFFDCHF